MSDDQELDLTDDELAISANDLADENYSPQPYVDGLGSQAAQ